MPVKTTKATKKNTEIKLDEKPVLEKKSTIKNVSKKTIAEKEDNKMPVKKVASKEKTTTAKKAETKPEVEKAPSKTETVKMKVKKTPEKKAATKTATTKKVEVKKASAKKVETKTETKKAPAKKVATKIKAATAKKAEVKKTSAKKVETKKVVKKAVSKTKKEETKVSKRKVSQKKMTKEEQYNNLSVDTCLDLAHAMAMDVTRDSIIQQLILNPDVASVSQDLINKYQLKGKFKFEEDGFDADLIPVLVSKIYETAEIKPEKAEDLQADVNQALNYKFTDLVADGEEYKAQFDTMRKVLMIAQHKEIHDSKVLDDEIGIDVEKFIVEFMDLAYNVLKSWKYEDVDYYEHFIYAVLSQLEDLHMTYRNRIMMDVADLYILHGDYGLGDADYGYILRENQIKDYIYYRYASIYEDIDKDKAKQIANQALQFVDDRFTYYPNIMAVLEG